MFRSDKSGRLSFKEATIAGTRSSVSLTYSPLPSLHIDRDEPHVQPKVFWKSGPNKSENLFLQSTKQPSDHFKRDEIPTTPSSLTRRSATGTPLPMPSPNKGFTQRPITPNSPLVEIQRKRKYQNVHVVSSPKYTPSTPVDYEEGRSTPKPTPRSSNSHVRFLPPISHRIHFSSSAPYHPLYQLRDFVVHIFLTFALQGKFPILHLHK
jgi:hypothetical protein